MPDRSVRYAALAAVSVGALSAVISVAILPADVPAARGAYFFFKNFTYWSLWALLMPVAVFVATWIRARVRPSALTVAAHIGAATLCAAIHLVVLYSIDVVLSAQFLGHALGTDELLREFITTPRLVWEWELTMYGALAAMAYANALAVEVRRHAVTQARLEASLSEARLLALQRQLQPHFLFNTLHAITALIRRDPDTAERMVDRLGRLLRATIKYDAATEVSLSDDLAVARDYLDIQAAQMRERLSVSFDVDPAVLMAAVPVLLIQPLVENAIRHGLQPRARGGRVQITATRRDDRLDIDIVDDGVGLPEEGALASGVGLMNTRSRLAQLYGDRQRFLVTRAPTQGVHVNISLPFRSIAHS